VPVLLYLIFFSANLWHSVVCQYLNKANNFVQTVSDVCAVTIPYVLLPLMVCLLSRPRFRRYFYERAAVFTATSFLTEGNIKDPANSSMCIPKTVPYPKMGCYFLWSLNWTRITLVENATSSGT